MLSPTSRRIARHETAEPWDAIRQCTSWSDHPTARMRRASIWRASAAAVGRGALADELPKQPVASAARIKARARRVSVFTLS